MNLEETQVRCGREYLPEMLGLEADATPGG
jgi:hypothetical protein